MRSLMCKWAALCFVMLSFVACSESNVIEDIPELQPEPELVEFTLSASDHAENAADESTRTYLDAAGKVYWHATDKLNVYEVTAQNTFTTNQTTETKLSADGAGVANRIADFTVVMPRNEATNLTYYASLGGCTLSKVTAEGAEMALELPATQTPDATSFDPATDLLVSLPKGPCPQPQQGEAVRFAFNRVNAFAQMTIKGIDPNETLTGISFATTTENIAGAATFSTATETLTKSTTTEAKKIVLDPKNLTKAGDNSYLVYFSLYPAKLADYTLTVNTTNSTTGKSYTYTKTVNRTGRELNFLACTRTQWGVTLIDKTENVSEVYKLVEDVTSVKAGDEIVLVGLKNSTSTYYALGGQNTGDYRDAVIVTVDAAAKTCELAQGVTVLTVEAGSEPNSVAFKDGAAYLAYTKPTGTKKNNNLWTSTINDKQAAWVISKGTGTNEASIKNQYNTGRFLQFNQSDPRFAGYTGTQEDVFIYRKTAGSGSNESFTALATPQPKSDVYSDTSITVNWTDVAHADNYTVTCKKGTDVVATQTGVKKADASATEVTATFNDLVAQTEYTIEVVANPQSGSTEFTKSAVGIVTVTTSAKLAKDDFRLVTSAAEMTDGEYILVAKAGNKNYAMPTPAINGKLDGVAVTLNPDGNSIAGTQAAGKVWTLKKTGSTCTLFDGANYLGHTAKDTQLDKSAEPFAWTIVDATATDPLYLQSSAEASRGILFHIETFNDFGGYSLSNKDNVNYTEVLFFRRDAGVIIEKTPLATPTLTVGAVTETSIEINWTEDLLVNQYLVTVTNTTNNQVVVGPDFAYDAATLYGVVITKLDPDTEYKFEVVATPKADDATHTNSVAATLTQKTAAQGGGEVTPSSDFVQISTLEELGNGGEVVLVSHYATGAKPYNALPAKVFSAGTILGTEITPNTSVTPATIDESAVAGHIWTLTKTTTGYTLSFDANGATNYLDKGSKSTQILTSTTSHEWQINNDATYGLMIVDNGTTRHLGAASGNTGKIGAYTEAKTYSPVLIFMRKSGGSTPEIPTQTPLATPQVTTSVTGTTITVNWQAITGAKDYTVTCGSQTQNNVTATSATFTVAGNNTYAVSVVAHPSDTAKNSDSEAGKTSVTIGGASPAPSPSTQLPGYFQSHTGWPELLSSENMPENTNRFYYCHRDFDKGTQSVKANDMRNYSFCYDSKYLCSRWVAYPMTAEHLAGTGRTDKWRIDDKFEKEYPGVPQPAVGKGSYADGLHARGHLMASADRKIDTPSTTIATNVAPEFQNGHNAGVWSKLEDAVRNMIPQGDTLFVVSGVHFDETNYTIKYVNDKAGQSCGIPTHFYKVILRKKAGVHKPAVQCTAAELETTAYWVDHDYNGTTWNPYDSYRTTVADVEAKTGLKFFINVPAAPKTQNSAF